MGYKLFTGRIICKKVEKSSSSGSKPFLLGVSDASSLVSESELQQTKIALKMQGGSYMYINRLGSYH